MGEELEGAYDEDGGGAEGGAGLRESWAERVLCTMREGCDSAFVKLCYRARAGPCKFNARASL